jgi:hypothetical protein
MNIGMALCTPEGTRNLMRQTTQIMADMERFSGPVTYPTMHTPEALSAAVSAGMQHLAAHKGDVRAAIASAKAAGMGADSNVARFIDASDEPPEFKSPEAPIQAFPPTNEELKKALEEEGFSPEEARELAEGDAAVALGILFFSRGIKFPATGSAGISPEEPIKNSPPAGREASVAVGEAAGGAAPASTGAPSAHPTNLKPLHGPETLRSNASAISYFISRGVEWIIESLFSGPEPIIVMPDGTVLNGNSRLHALKALGADPSQVISRLGPKNIYSPDNKLFHDR